MIIILEHICADYMVMHNQRFPVILIQLMQIIINLIHAIGNPWFKLIQEENTSKIEFTALLSRSGTHYMKTWSKYFRYTFWKESLKNTYEVDIISFLQRF